MSSVVTDGGYLSSISSPKSKLELRKSIRGRKYPEISVIGGSRLIDPTYNTKLKVFWALVLITVTSICINQTVHCIITYLSYPVIKDLTRVRVSNVTFPIIYLCPGFMRSVLFASIAARNDESDPRLKKIYTDLADAFNKRINAKSVEKFWQEELILATDAVEVYIACSEIGLEYCTEYGHLIPVNTKQISSFWGTCLILMTNFTVPYRGPFTFLNIIYNNQKLTTSQTLTKKIQDVKDSVSGVQNYALMFTLRSDFSFNNNHDLFYATELALEGFVTHYVISVKKFKFLNVKSEPCTESNEFTDCINDCLNHKLSQLNSSCRLPYVKNESLKSCDGDSTYKAYLDSYKFYLNFNSNSCDCIHNCQTTLYSVSSNVVDKTWTNSITRMQIFFNDDFYEETESRPSYGFFLLISDIGGTWSFFIGFCCLSVIEIFEFFIVWLSYRI